jgi:hypothetical protein
VRYPLIAVTIRSGLPVLTAITLAAWVPRAGAQTIRPLDASPRANLQFGNVLPGLPTSVPWSDAANAGAFDLRGTGGAEVRIELALPPALTGTGGASLPLSMGAGDGAYAQQPSLAAVTPFDPRLPLITTLGKSGRLYLRFGGTVRPSPSQRPGPYGSTVTITVSYTGV